MWVSGETNSRSGEQQAGSAMGAARLDGVGLGTAGAAVRAAAHHLMSAWGAVLRGDPLLWRLTCIPGSGTTPAALTGLPASMPAGEHPHHQVQGATA